MPSDAQRMAEEHGFGDLSLDNAVTENGLFSYDIIGLPNTVDEGVVIKDMVFDPSERTTRFAVGNAGVFFTLDGANPSRSLVQQPYRGTQWPHTSIAFPTLSIVPSM